MRSRGTQKNFEDMLLKVSKQTDLTFARLFVIQWILSVVIASVVSPRTWVGNESSLHPHVYLAVFLGGIITSLPLFCLIRYPGASANRFIVALAQVCWSVLLIHVTGGRIETHFHIFGSLAFLAFYRDWRVVVLASLLVAIDHLARGLFWPESIYGVLHAPIWRTLEHAGWVVFEDVFLLVMIKESIKEMNQIAEKQELLQETIASVEVMVQKRTQEVIQSQRVIADQQGALFQTAKLSALGEMAGGLAHEINNPLATIQILTSLLRDYAADAEVDRKGVEEVADTVDRTVKRIAKITGSLRQLSRSSSEDELVETPLKTLIEDTLLLCAEKFRDTQVELRVDCPEGGSAVLARATEISQVLLNLLNNSLDAVRDSKERPWVRIAVVESENHVDLTVTDSGSVIKADLREKIFQPFFSTKEVGKGIGLGLSVSKSIIEQHGGKLFLNEESAQTQFVVRFPKSRSAQAKAA